MLILIADQVARLQDVQTLLYERQHTHEAEALLQQLNQVREANNLPPLTLTPLGVNPACSNDQRINTLLFVAKGVLTFVWDRSPRILRSAGPAAMARDGTVIKR